MRIKGVIIAVAVLMTIFIAMMAFSRHASDPFARYQSFVSAHPYFQADFKTTFNGKSVPGGTLLVDRPKKRFLLTCQVPNAPYTVSSTEKGYVEIDKGSETYDENQAIGILAIAGSRITGSYRLAPSSVFANDLKKLVPANSSVTAAGDNSLLHGTAKSEMGAVEIWATVDGKGELTDMRIKTTGMGGTSEWQWAISYEFPTHLDLKNFETPLPRGFQPYSLARSLIPMQKGQVLPTTGWAKASGAGSADLLQISGHKPFLLAVLDNEGPSARSRASLATLQGKLPVIVVGKDVADPSGKLLAEINVPGTPAFFLADGKGKILKIWYGYDQDDKTAFESDVIDSMKEPPKPQTAIIPKRGTN